MLKKVVIDAGHGGKDPGAVSSTLKEKDITLEVAKLIQTYLLKRYKNIHVILTRDSDTFLTLQNRCKIANDAKVDLFISVHVNSAENEKASGYEDYIYSGLSAGSKTPTIRNTIHQSISGILPIRNRGKKVANYYVLKNTKMPAILLEIAFIKADGELLKSKVFLSDFSEAAAKGIAASLGIEN